MRRLSASVLCWQLLALQASAQEAAGNPVEELPVVTIQAIKDPVTWPYRTLLAGLDAFDTERGLAPSATLRFRIRNPRGLGGLALQLAGEHAAVDIPLDAESQFALGRGMVDDPGEAVLKLNRGRGEFNCDCLPQAVVRTPGLPANAVRIGDLRLECQVTMAIAKKQLGFLKSAGLSALGGMDWCDPRQAVKYAVRAPLPFNSVTFGAGGRRMTQRFDKTASTLKVRLADKTWPDDTLIEFDHVPEPAAASATR
ncbi:hypothetical protein [Pseudoduganella namucuonensis]|uniref:Uncharacterized protein n=1 Tax=Pseudoduganella namucuonensis TaxID=1035707 RepID=A0A1I7K151_9BURK|nr:hypothetical protein [Pseudoduganella namucuonensis]SFU91173.1 hypothetical protein SAMN05216552_101465 [Pseudoduganella namucuonensis]